MRARWVSLPLFILAATVCVKTIQAQKPEPRADPVMLSMHPFSVQSGSNAAVVVRGRGLRGARAVFAPGAPFRVVTEGVEPEPPGEGGNRGRAPVDLVRLRVEAPAGAKAGRYVFRLITANGVSNALPLYVTEAPVMAEPAGAHDSAESAAPVPSVPAVVAGKLSRRGESDFYAIQAAAGETFTFELLSGLPQTAAGGSAATIANFDPSLTIYERSGSWLDPARLRRVAYNDEPVWVIGKSTDPRLVHRFERAGTYYLRVEAFAGQGGPDYSYQLRVLPGAVPEAAAPKNDAWEERSYTRALSPDRLNQLAARGAARKDRGSVETYRAAPVPAAEAPLFKLPGTLEGGFTREGETHRARFDLAAPADIAFEIETPDLAPPFFNPIVRLLGPGGEEAATNVMAGRGACSGALSKSLQAKTVVPLRETGTYTIEVRDAIAAPPPEVGALRYRVQVRPQVPHLGQVRIDVERVNIAPEEAKTIRVTFDREEEYRGEIAVIAEGLPPGIHAVPGADYEPEPDNVPRPGKRERYTGKSERTVLVLTASADAPPTPEPVVARIVARAMAGGRIGEIVASRTFPMMVLGKP